MAEIKSKIIKINLSKLVRSNDNESITISDDLAANIEAIVQELVDDSIIVEVIEE